MRDLPQSRDLLALARELLLDELAPLLPAERIRDVHLIATAMAIAAREAQAGEGWQGEIARRLSDFDSETFEAAEPEATHPRKRGRGRAGTSAAPAVPSPASGGGSGWGHRSDETIPKGLLARFAAELRNGAFETSPSRCAAARAILWRLTTEKLGEGNPHFLAANGFSRAGLKGD